MSKKDRTLDNDQAKAIASILTDEFNPIIRRRDPHFSGFATVSGWVAERKKRIFDELEVFKTAAVKQDLKHYKGVVDRKFRNHYAKMKEKSSPMNDLLPKLFIPRTTAFALYEADVKKEFLEGADDDTVEGDDAIERYHMRVAQSWNDLGKTAHKRYEQEVETVADNVEHNRKLLSDNMSTALDILCREKRLGGLMATTLISYRDLGSGEIKVTVCEGHTADDIPKFWGDAEEEGVLSAFKNAWRKYADRHIPRRPTRSTSSSPAPSIPINRRGIPVFPSVNIRDLLPSAVEDIIFQYFDAVWTYSRNPHHPLDIPWEDIAQNASDFYDAEQYNYMCFDKTSLTRTPAKLYELAQELQDHCSIDSQNPFTFVFAPASDNQEAEFSSARSNDAAEESYPERTPRSPGFESFDLFSTPVPEPTENIRFPPKSLRTETHQAGTSQQFAEVGSNSSCSNSPPKDDDSQPPPRSVLRRNKRKDAVETPDSLTETRASKTVNQAKTKSDVGAAQGPIQKRARFKNAVEAQLSAQPVPVEGERDVFTSKGYKLKLSKRFRSSCFISLSDYTECGGYVLDAACFDSHEEILAMTLFALDPEWLANQKEWENNIIGRP